MNVTWTIRCKLVTCPDTWTVLHADRKEPLPDILKEVEHAMSSPFGKFVVPGTMEVVGSDGQHFQLAGMASIPVAALLAALMGKVEAPVAYPEDFDPDAFQAKGGRPGLN